MTDMARILPEQSARPRLSPSNGHQTDIPGTRYLRRCESIGRDVKVTGPVLVRGRGSVIIGDNVVLDAAAGPIELLATDGGRLEVSADTYVGPGASIEAAESVCIGPGAVIGPFAKILDNNWHSSFGDHAERPQCAPVAVGAGARVGARATLLPGSSLGPGSILDDDSVLSGRVPGGAIVAGVPARLVRKYLLDEPVARASWQPGPGQETEPPFRYVDHEFEPVNRWLLRWLSAYEDLNRLSDPKTGSRLLAHAELLGARVNGRHRLRDAQRAERAVVHGALDVRNNGWLEIGAGCGFASGPVTSRLDVGPGAKLSIGPGAVINFGVLISTTQSITIGSRLLMGSRTVILDTHGGVTSPITIGNDVWLAHGVTVLPGVSIGDGSAISAGTVVGCDVPPGCMAVGNPPRIRALPVVSA